MEKCYAKVGEPFQMHECGDAIEYVKAGDLIHLGQAEASYTGWYHIHSGHAHHAVSRESIR